MSREAGPSPTQAACPQHRDPDGDLILNNGKEQPIILQVRKLRQVAGPSGVIYSFLEYFSLSSPSPQKIPVRFPRNFQLRRLSPGLLGTQNGTMRVARVPLTG